MADASPAWMKSRRLLSNFFFPFGGLAATHSSVGLTIAGLALNHVSVAPKTSCGGTIETRSTGRLTGDDCIAVVNSRITPIEARTMYGNNENERNRSNLLPC